MAQASTLGRVAAPPQRSEMRFHMRVSAEKGGSLALLTECSSPATSSQV